MILNFSKLQGMDSMSKSNVFEATFLAALCRYFIRQGYSSQQITVLTTYTGQMFLLKKKVRAYQECEGVRVTSVDSFQGEENDIILLSLVRSNQDNSIGFMSIENRICVSLSRARLVLSIYCDYIICSDFFGINPLLCIFFLQTWDVHNWEHGNASIKKSNLGSDSR